MNSFFNVAMIAVLALLSTCIYWYCNPHQIPRVLRDNVPEFAVPSPKSPMSSFRPPQFGPQ